MEQVETSVQDVSTEKDSVELAWTAHPFLSNPLRSALLVLFLGAVWTGVYLVFRSPAFVTIAVVFLLFSLRQYFLPTKFVFETENVKVVSPFSTVKRPWSDFKTFAADRHGALLSPFPGRSALESFRGTYVIFSGNSAEVVGYLSCRMPSQQKAAAAKEGGR
jgi:hypothetical protein